MSAKRHGDPGIDGHSHDGNILAIRRSRVGADRKLLSAMSLLERHPFSATDDPQSNDDRCLSRDRPAARRMSRACGINYFRLSSTRHGSAAATVITSARMTHAINVLVPTFRRIKALSVTLTSLYYQWEDDFDVIISDQSPENEIFSDNSILTAVRLLELKGHKVSLLKNLPRKGLAQQRQFLLERAEGAYALFLDDDLILDPFVIRNMKRILLEQRCGFAGSAVIGLSFLQSYRPEEEQIELWDDRVVPEDVSPGSKAWMRYRLHNAANVYHVQRKLGVKADHPIPYKIAWVGGCVLYDKQKLLDVGGFNFWKRLPAIHCGEDVLAQLRVMKKFGGCAILPSGVYHQELETTVPDRRINAPEVIGI